MELYSPRRLILLSLSSDIKYPITACWTLTLAYTKIIMAVLKYFSTMEKEIICNNKQDKNIGEPIMEIDSMLDDIK